MDSHVYKKASYRLPALAGIAVLRFNTRGTSSPRGTSDGPSRRASASAWTLRPPCSLPWTAACPTAGCGLVLRHRAGAQVRRRGTGRGPGRGGRAAVAAAAPGRGRRPCSWAAYGKPLTVLVPEFDDYLQPEAAAARFALVPQASMVPVAGAKHLWVGEKYAARALDEIASTVLGTPVQLPGSGPAPWPHCQRAARLTV